MSVVLYVIKNNVIKITSLMNSLDGSFFKPFKTLEVRALSDIKHSCFISDKAPLLVF